MSQGQECYNISMTENKKELWQKEVDKNYSVFLKELPGLLRSHPDKYLIMHKGKQVGIFDTAEDAYQTAELLYKNNEPYSIQKITGEHISLGWQGHALF